MRFYITCFCGAPLLVTSEQVGTRIACFRCNAPVEVVLPPPGQEVSSAWGTGPEAEAAAQRDLAMEAHLVSAGLALRGGVILLFACEGPAMLFLAWHHAGLTHEQLGFYGVASLLALAAGLAFFVTGHHLARFSARARIGLWIVVALITLPAAFGTLVFAGIGFLFDIRFWHLSLTVWGTLLPLHWLLLNPRARRVCSQPYAELRAASPGLRPKLLKQPSLWIAMAILAADAVGYVAIG
ncbi:MAG: hypothetical protein HYY93_09570 [Planctomycetes bacterium]|nr:hypothetical protein [Planctomycetota bacterium]